MPAEPRRFRQQPGAQRSLKLVLHREVIAAIGIKLSANFSWGWAIFECGLLVGLTIAAIVSIYGHHLHNAVHIASSWFTVSGAGGVPGPDRRRVLRSSSASGRDSRPDHLLDHRAHRARTLPSTPTLGPATATTSKRSSPGPRLHDTSGRPPHDAPVPGRPDQGVKEVYLGLDLGTSGLGVREPGQVAYIAGTSSVILGISDRLVLDPAHRFLVTPLAEPGQRGVWPPPAARLPGWPGCSAAT